MLPYPPSILLIAESHTVYAQLHELVKAGVAGGELLWTTTPDAAQAVLAARSVDLLILTHAMRQVGWPARADTSRPAVVLLFDTPCAEMAELARGADADDYVALDELDARLLGRIVRYALERRRLQQASAQQLRRVLDNSRDVIYQLNLQTRTYDYVTPSVADVLGYSVAEFMASTAEQARELTFPEDRDRVEAHVAQLLAGAAPDTAHEIEYRALTRHRGWRWVATNRRVVHDAAGAPVALVGSIRDVTAEKQQLETLRESEQRFRRIIETTEEGVFVIELPATITYVNDRMLEMLGYTAAEVIGRSLFDLVPPEIAAILATSLHQRQQGKRAHYEAPLLHKNGSRVWCRVAAAPMLDDAGTVTGSFGMVQDVSARRHVEAARDRLAAIVEASPDCVATLTTGYELLSLNRAGRALLGLAPDADITQINVGRFVPTALHERIAGDVVPAALRDGYWSGESTLQSLDGHTFPVSLVLRAHKDRAGNVDYFSTIARDISERARAEAALITSEARKSAILESALDAFVTIDSAGHILEFNTAAEKMFRHAREDVVGQEMADLLIPPQWRRSHRRGMRHYARTGESALMGQRLELTAMRSDGSEFPVELTIVGVSIAGQMIFTSFIRDITERKRSEAALRDSQQRLQIALQAANVGLWDSDLQRGTSDFSPEWKRQLGYEPAEIGTASDEWDRRVHPDDHPAAQAAVSRCLAGETPTYTNEFRMRHKDGSYRWIMSQATVLRRADGTAYRMLGAHLDITERKQALEAVRTSEQRLAHAQEIARLGSWTRDLQTGAVTWSDEMFRIFGLDRTTTSPETVDIRSYVHLEDQAIFEQFATAIGVGTGMESDHRVVRPDGTVRYVRHRVAGGRTADGQLIRITGTMLDITERKVTDDELRYQANLLQNVSDAIVATDMRYVITSWNRAAELLYGWTAAEAIGRSAGVILESQYEGTSPDDVMHEFRRQGAWRGEAIQHHRDGTIVNVLSSITLIKDAAGTPIGVVAANRDITDLKRADSAARASRERLDIALRSAKIGLWEWTAVSDMYSVSPEWKQMLGYTLDELTQAPEPTALMHPDDVVAAHERWRTQLEGSGMEYTNTYRLRHKDGSYRWMLVQGTIIRGSAGRPERMIGTQVDISELKHAEEALLRAASRLQLAHDQLELRVQERTLELVAAKDEAERANAAKSEFLSRMSHELRTPMNSILGFAQIMEMDELSAKQTERVGYIIKAGQHLLQLINEVLDLARVESGRLSVTSESVCVQQVVQLTSELIQPQILQRNQRLIYEWDLSTPLYVAADLQRLSQVLLNLLSNAAKYNRSGGEIRVLAAPQPNDRVRITVVDTGPGIAMVDRARLFQPFERLDASAATEGTGLGLALSKRLVELMGGQMDVASTPGVGSRFWIELPAARPALAAAEQTAVPQPEPPEQAHTVVYIEDQLANAAVIEHALAGQPHITLRTAATGRAGLELVQSCRPTLVLLDLQLPDMHGAAVLQQLRADPATSAIAVVIISADATPHRMRQALTQGAADYLTKPLDVRLLVGVIHSILKKAETSYAS